MIPITSKDRQGLIDRALFNFDFSSLIYFQEMAVSVVNRKNPVLWVLVMYVYLFPQNIWVSMS